METLLTGRPFNFLTHPNEFINEEREEGQIQRRGANYLSYLMGDIIRHKLKTKNLGQVAIPLLERELLFFAQKNFRFFTCKELYLHYKNKRSQTETS